MNDVFNLNNSDNVPHNADYFIHGNTITYVYKYPYFTFPVDNTSTIHSDHLSYHHESKLRSLKTWEDLL